jgi:anti-anti-sigma regulatory factor
LGGLSFMDSTGVGVAMDAALRAATLDVELLIVPGPPAVQRVLEALISSTGCPSPTESD